jgi:hypothetical protein
MKKVQKFSCWICGDEFDEKADAAKCERKGLSLPRFKIGDTVWFRIHVGYMPDYGEIIDILFPDPRGEGLAHWYEVRYLIRVTRRQSDKEPVFDQERIELLQTIRGHEEVPEGMIEDVIRDKKNGPIVRSWDEYVAGIVRKNRGLKERLERFTAHLRKAGKLD